MLKDEGTIHKFIQIYFSTIMKEAIFW